MPLRPRDRIGLCAPLDSAAAKGEAPLPTFALAFEDLLSGQRPWLPPCREVCAVVSNS